MSGTTVLSGCNLQGSFTQLDFFNASLIQSHLGGQGGRCASTTFRDGTHVRWEELCHEPQPGYAHEDVNDVPPTIADT